MSTKAEQQKAKLEKLRASVKTAESQLETALVALAAAEAEAESADFADLAQSVIDSRYGDIASPKGAIK
jgi:soluble cytochrome b562